MTSERKKAIAIISATLIVGVLIGVLATGMFARHHYHGRKDFGNEYRGMRSRFAEKIYKTTRADSAQIKQMQPIVDQTMTHIDTLQRKTEKEVKALMDSMIIQLKPFLKAEQLTALEKFSTNKGDYSGHRRTHR
jgi:hypothetical protein